MFSNVLECSGTKDLEMVPSIDLMLHNNPFLGSMLSEMYLFRLPVCDRFGQVILSLMPATMDALLGIKVDYF